MNNRDRMLAVISGEMTDKLMFCPRLDLWFPAHLARGTIPEEYKDLNKDGISEREGWVPYRFMPDFVDIASPDEILHRGLGLISNRNYLCKYEFDAKIDISVTEDHGATTVEYRTPFGVISTKTALTEDQRKNGGTYPLVIEHAIKDVADYESLAFIFQNIRIIPDYEKFSEFERTVGGKTLCFASAGMASSPMHHILRDFLDPTSFFLHYKDHQAQMRMLAEAMTGFYDSLIDVSAKSPARGIVWGANYDDMLTYPEFFEKEMLPWITKACETFHRADKIVGSHCDGENRRLLDLIRESGLDVADSVCPNPMTKVPIREYYERWCDRMTIFGGIPQDFLLPDSTSVRELHDYMDTFFRSIAPGKRFIVGIADAVPPDADFDRLRIIAEHVAKQGRLPLFSGHVETTPSGIAVSPKQVPTQAGGEVSEVPQPSPGKSGDPFESVRNDVLGGDHVSIKDHIAELLERGLSPQDILDKGMLAAMEIFGQKFRDGSVFIPEVLLAARAVNTGVGVLEPHLGSAEHAGLGKVMIGTVQGDMHDIGKNIVLSMLRGVGFETVDLGINVPTKEFVRQVEKNPPDILGLSALLTTTMPEMRKVIDALKEAGLREKVKILVGGAPVNEKFARHIGADGYARDAGEAIDVAKQLRRLG